MIREYTICYKMTEGAEYNWITVMADSKYDAYDKATYEAIPTAEGSIPYSSWLESVKYKNGKIHHFNFTMEGYAY